MESTRLSGMVYGMIISYGKYHESTISTIEQLYMFWVHRKQVAFGDLHSMSHFHLWNDMIEWNEITWTAAWTDGWIDAMDEWMEWNEMK